MYHTSLIWKSMRFPHLWVSAKRECISQSMASPLSTSQGAVTILLSSPTHTLIFWPLAWRATPQPSVNRPLQNHLKKEQRSWLLSENLLLTLQQSTTPNLADQGSALWRETPEVQGSPFEEMLCPLHSHRWRRRCCIEKQQPQQSWVKKQFKRVWMQNEQTKNLKKIIIATKILKEFLNQLNLLRLSFYMHKSDIWWKKNI